MFSTEFWSVDIIFNLGMMCRSVIYIHLFSDWSCDHVGQSNSYLGDNDVCWSGSNNVGESGSNDICMACVEE